MFSRGRSQIAYFWFPQGVIFLGVCDKNGISRGEGGPFCETVLAKTEERGLWEKSHFAIYHFGKNRGEGVMRKIPSEGGMDIFWNYTLSLDEKN